MEARLALCYPSSPSRDGVLVADVYRFGVKVRPLHWYLRNGLLRGVGAPRLQSGQEKKSEVSRRNSTQSDERGCHEVVPGQV